MIAFVDRYREQRTGSLKWGVGPICEVLGFAPQTYYTARSRPPSARQVHDICLKPEIRRVWEDNYRVEDVLFLVELG